MLGFSHHYQCCKSQHNLRMSVRDDALLKSVLWSDFLHRFAGSDGGNKLRHIFHHESLWVGIDNINHFLLMLPTLCLAKVPISFSSKILIWLNDYLKGFYKNLWKCQISMWNHSYSAQVVPGAGVGGAPGEKDLRTNLSKEKNCEKHLFLKKQRKILLEQMLQQFAICAGENSVIIGTYYWF